MRVLTYNVRSLQDDPMATAAVIRACAPDVVCVQEAPRKLRWRSKRAALARESGLVVATADQVGGLMLMTAVRCRVVRQSFTRLSQTPGLHERALVSADIEVDGATWRVASMHLGLRGDERLRHVEEIFGALGDEPRTVLAGDANERASDPAWGAITRRFTDAFTVAPVGGRRTFPAHAPNRRIDAIFVSEDITVLSCGVPDVPGVAQGSDHRPVLAELG